MDKEQTEADDRLVQLGQAIRTAAADRGLSQQALADLLGVHNSQVSRIVNGHAPELSLEQVRRIEDVMSLRRGFLLRTAGYVELDGIDTREQIQSDPALSAEDRATVLRIYEALANPVGSSGASNSDGSNTAPTAPSKRRS